MTDVQATFFATLVDEWARCGVTDAVVCPGNRSTLLAAQLVADDRLRVHVMVDERSAAFFALGLGLASGRPALFWCTSGTAAAEAHAAVIEAHQGQVPLLVCTADRPPELHHARDWQSVDQTRLYGDALRWRHDPGVAAAETAPYWRSIAARSVIETMHNGAGPGPVHLNLPIREPWRLEPGELPVGRADGRPWHTLTPARRPPADEVVDALAIPGRRGVVVAGRGQADPKVVHRCAEALGWPVIADARSGARLPRKCTVAAADSLVRSPHFADAHRPEVVLRIGAPVLSKSVASWLREAEAEEWIVGPHDVWQGPASSATHIVDADPTLLAEAVASAASPADEAWLKGWQRSEEAAQAAITAALPGEGITEPGIARAVAAAVPAGGNLFAATSMPVRDIESYAAPRDGLRVFANRGASGMDGITSTAAAVSVATSRPTVLLIGDLSFLYDLNALWSMRGAASTVDLVAVVIDNDGGGIFSTIPHLRSVDPEIFERVIAAPHGMDIAGVARAMGAKAAVASSLDQVVGGVREGVRERGLHVVVVKTRRDQAVDVRRQVNAAVAEALR